MTSETIQFHQEFLQAVHRAADADGKFLEDAFFEAYSSHVTDAGDLEEANRAYFNTGRGVRVDGYGGDPIAQEGVLTLITLDVNTDDVPQTLTATDLDAAMKRTLSYVQKSLDSRFRDSMEESSPGFGLADTIAGAWRGIIKVRILLMSNRMLSKRVDGKAEGSLDGRPVVYSVWDLERLRQYVKSGRAREDMVIDLSELGGPLQALRAHEADSELEAYLVVVPGQQLADIYDRWGARLLEQNVRVFLQARGKVNRGMRATLADEPEMFFAYNNGITATAEEVTTQRAGHGLAITSIRNLQIVNGGQTTGSIYSASNSNIDLKGVAVQLKLSIVSPERAELIVPRISQFANTQNRISAADFFSNHPYHLRMKMFSEAVFAPAHDGSFRQSKWFYERARGQYQDARSKLSAAEQRRFDLEYPRDQVFTKTDLAKFMNVWEGRPEVVSRGAQRNFAEFAEAIGRRWDVNPDEFNERYFKTVVAKLLVFRATERLVTERPWYEGGYRANIVAYAIAKLALDLSHLSKSVDFDRIWNQQRLGVALEDSLRAGADGVRSVIENPPEGSVKNITEWAKHERCWQLVGALEVDWPSGLQGELVSGGDQKVRARAARREQKVMNSVESQLAVFNAGSPFWRAVHKWATGNRLLSSKNLQIMEAAFEMPRRTPSEKQCEAIMASYAELRSEGMPLDLPTSDSPSG